jgi:BirA family transcriptional regulator, biotin operon repressor / biotin---[acetyl-CoA-carboxylase] ligase
LSHRTELRHGDVIFTQRQTAGRGRQGRAWQSPPGVLTASVVLEGCAGLPELSLAAGLAVIYAVEDLSPNLQNQLRLKWPNDVLYEGRKLAGILCEASLVEASAQSDRGLVIVGIGLNHCVSFEDAELAALAPQTMSLHQIAATVPSEWALLERLRHYLLETAGLFRFQAQTAETGFARLLPALRQRDALVGQTITIRVGTEHWTGQAMGLNEHGHLCLRLPSGNQQTFVTGHITT